MIIYLIGPRAVGKSTVGAALAHVLGCPFVDSDALICQNAGCSVADVVAREGWPAFRARESAALHEGTHRFAASPAGGVMATGGGMVLAEANRRFLRESGTVLFLTAPLATLRARLLRGGHTRPSLGGVKTSADEIAEVLAERLPLYESTAHHRVDCTGAVPDLCEKILQLLDLKK